MKTPKFWLKNGLIPLLFSPIAFIYGFVTQWRIKHNKPFIAKAKVICVGNITAGGVGKTPVAIALAKQYLEQNKKVFFVTRGYKGKLKNILVDLNKHTPEETGDEARLLASIAPTIIAPKRDIGAQMAQQLGAEVIILDDGFQNPRLYKDESFLVFDGQVGIGNGKIIPSGPLRETLTNGEKRADYIIIMGKDKTNLQALCHKPVFYGRLEAQKLILENKNVLAFAGIGHPSKFYQTLKDEGFNVVKAIDFEDHHTYTIKELDELIETSKKERLTPITTEKDFVKLPLEYQKDIFCLKVNAVWSKEKIV